MTISVKNGPIRSAKLVSLEFGECMIYPQELIIVVISDRISRASRAKTAADLRSLLVLESWFIAVLERTVFRE
jgi:hypothetical protein